MICSRELVRRRLSSSFTAFGCSRRAKLSGAETCSKRAATCCSSCCLAAWANFFNFVVSMFRGPGLKSYLFVIIDFPHYRLFQRGEVAINLRFICQQGIVEGWFDLT